MSKTELKNACCSSCATDIFEEPLWEKKDILVILSSGIFFAIGLYFEFIAKTKLFAQIFFMIVVFLSGREIIIKSIQSLLKKKFDMNFLISLAAFGAFLIGHGEEGAAVMFLFFIAEFLEEYAAQRARNSIGKLLNLAPDTATVKKHGKEQVLNVRNINVGDIIIIKPGDRIPLDGIVKKGKSFVNQAPITGESMPVLKIKNDNVFAGTLNEEGYLEIKVTKKSTQTTLSKIIKLVENAQNKKSKSEVFIDKFARYYTPIIIILAFLVMSIPPIFFSQPFNDWFYRALVLLVSACPCALAISTPVSMVSALTSAARNGVLIKGGEYIEEIRHAKVVVFDKTGTLTKGKPVVTDIVSFNDYTDRDVLQIAASLESRSKHPLAKSILEKAKNSRIKLKKPLNFTSVTGKGLKGKINGKRYYIGNKSFFNLEIPNKTLYKLQAEGKTAILVANDKLIIGIIAIMDTIRDSAKETINELKRQGIRTIMLTGDNKKTAEAISKKLDMDEYHAELLPEDKVKKVEELLNEYEHVIMLGDGVNDAPALAKAHAGIAMGAAGSDVAIETADIALMQDDISKVTYLINLSKKTMSVVKQNIILSIIIKGSFAILTIPGFISLWLAVAVGDMGLSLVVIMNALRIGGKEK